jgi:hypothetical protein
VDRAVATKAFLRRKAHRIGLSAPVLERVGGDGDGDGRTAAFTAFSSHSLRCFWNFCVLGESRTEDEDQAQKWGDEDALLVLLLCKISWMNTA